MYTYKLVKLKIKMFKNKKNIFSFVFWYKDPKAKKNICAGAAAERNIYGSVTLFVWYGLKQ